MLTGFDFRLDLLNLWLLPVEFGLTTFPFITSCIVGCSFIKL